MAWELNGNAIGAIPEPGAFLGTTDAQPLIIRTGTTSSTTPPERLRVTPEGRVGIGITDPQAKLVVSGGGAIVNNVAIGTDTTSVSYLNEYETVGAALPGGTLRLQSPNGLAFHTGPTGTTLADNLRMTITPSGEVGLGKAPGSGYKLDVAGTVNATDYHKNGSALVSSQWADVSGGINYTGGNVGIGKAPAANHKLEVAGILNAADYHKGGVPLVASQWADVSGGINYTGGNVGIGTTAPGARLDISGSGEANQCCAPVPPTLSLAEASSAQNRQAWLQFHNRGEAEAYIRLAGAGRAGSGREGQRRFEIGDSQGVNTSLTVQGNVGIGTTEPNHRLHVRTVDAVGLFESTGPQAYLRLSTTEGLDNRVEITNRPGGRLSLWTAGAGDGFNVTRDGNVGIGKINPGARLEVAGGDIRLEAGRTLYSPGRLHIHGEEILFLLNKGGVHVSRAWGGSGNLTIDGELIAGSLTAQNMVSAQSHGDWAPAVFGKNLGPNGIGVLGRDESPSGGLAGYFVGKTEVEGNFRVLGGFAKNFRIDHPLAPAEKYLDHTCVESSERKNVYDGVERLDEDGSAWVELPEWFEALNKDYRYQLTAIGGAASELHIAEEISDNRFRIAGGKAEMKVCWQISGIRSDPGAEANPMMVEEDKTEEERGRYIQPELYGAPEEQRIMRGLP